MNLASHLMSAGSVAARGAVVAIVAVVLAACSAANADSVTLELMPLNDSGVSGTVRLSALDGDSTLVVIEVDPAGHLNMPGHVHPGTCADLVPQPKYALESVRNGQSRTEVAASLEDLLAGGQAINLHLSNEQMDIYSACVDLS